MSGWLEKSFEIHDTSTTPCELIQEKLILIINAILKHYTIFLFEILSDILVLNDEIDFC